MRMGNDHAGAADWQVKASIKDAIRKLTEDSATDVAVAAPPCGPAGTGKHAAKKADAGPAS
jgi:hypothetical protein